MKREDGVDYSHDDEGYAYEYSGCRTMSMKMLRITVMNAKCALCGLFGGLISHS